MDVPQVVAGDVLAQRVEGQVALGDCVGRDALEVAEQPGAERVQRHQRRTDEDLGTSVHSSRAKHRRAGRRVSWWPVRRRSRRAARADVKLSSSPRQGPAEARRSGAPSSPTGSSNTVGSRPGGDVARPGRRPRPSHRRPPARAAAPRRPDVRCGPPGTAGPAATDRAGRRRPARSTPASRCSRRHGPGRPRRPGPPSPAG